MSPLFIPTMIGNIAAGNLSIRYGLRGECLNVVTACATGAHSIGAAVRDIRHGYIDAALAGGSEESVSPICLAGFANLGALSKADDPPRRRCRSTRAAPASWRARARARWCSSRSSTRSAAVRRCSPRSRASAPPATPTT
ncbi:MAG: beta-ketoacyl synthase N-terminal-like domain-containing protein [Gordonibacter pamelaeae]